MAIPAKTLFILSLIMLASGLTAGSVADERQIPVGEWTFDDSDSLLAAQVGNPLELVGLHEAIEGPEVGDGAVRIGQGSYYRCFHDISANGAGDPQWVNRFTLVMDIRIPQIGEWYCLYQSNYNNTNDGEWFIHPNGTVGVGDTGYSTYTLVPGEWYRLAVSANLGEHYDYYLDGQLLHAGGAQAAEGRFALYPADGANEVLFFADDNGEDNLIDVAAVQLYDLDLGAEELADLGGYGHEIPGPPSYLMQPYLQSPTSSSIHIGWHSIGGVASHLEYGLDENLGSQKPALLSTLDPSTFWHDAQLSGLDPDTRYFYRCVSGADTSQVEVFKTQAADDAENQHIRFMVYGDNRTEADQHEAVVRAFRDKALELYGPNLEEGINLVLNVGDIVTTGTVLSQYQTEYFYPISSVSKHVPYMVSIGNHEVEAAYYYEYMRYEDFAGAEGEKYYAFNVGPVLFVGLNSNTQGETQLTWLETVLDAAELDSGIDWVFVYLHHPGRSELWPDGNTAWVNDSVIPILVDHGKVEGLFYGHSHNYERGVTNEGNLRLLLSGGGGSALDRWGMYANQEDYPEIHRSHDYYCYVIFDIDCAGRSYTASSYGLGHEDRPADNELFDSFSRHLDDPPPSTPQAIAPMGEGPRNPLLEASDFIGDHAIMSSQFQLVVDGADWSEALVDSVRHWENVYGDSGAPDWLPIDLNEGLDLTRLQLGEDFLWPGHTYTWRVRYRDRNLSWSEWSDSIEFNVTATEQGEAAPPTGSRLGHIAPNPFNPHATIHFSMAQEADMKLDVYDMRGRHLRSLLSGTLSAGEHIHEWDGRSSVGKALPSGLYLISLQTGNSSQTRKAILLK
jgi:hypothetical protein